MMTAERINVADRAKFGDTLRKALRNKEWTQTYVARKLGVRQQTVSVWLKGLNYPSYHLMVKLSAMLDMPIHKLAPGLGVERPPEELYPLIDAWGRLSERDRNDILRYINSVLDAE